MIQRLRRVRESRGAGISALWLACLLGCAADERASSSATEPLSITRFDVAEAGWGDAPLGVHFVWQVAGAAGRTLACKVDVDGDGTYDLELPRCKADTTLTAATELPSHTFASPGQHAPRLSVSDGKTTLETTTTVFANKLNFAPNVVFPEQAPGFLGAVQSADGVTLHFAPGPLPPIPVGSIVWGTSEGGYLLRVRAVSANAQTVTVDGTSARMEEAVESGFFGVRDVRLHGQSPRCIGGDECAGLSVEAAEPARPGRLDEDIGVQQRALEINKGELGPKLKFQDGPFELSMFWGGEVKQLILEFEGFSIKHYSVLLDAKFQAEYAIQYPDARSRTFTWHLGRVVLGLVPIALVLRTTATWKTVAKVQGSFEVVAPVGCRYGPTWSCSGKLAFNALLSPTVRPPQDTVGLGVEAIIAPKLVAAVLGIAGPYVEPTVSATWEVKVPLPQDAGVCDQSSWSCPIKAVAGGRFGVELLSREPRATTAEFELISLELGDPCASQTPCRDAGAGDASSESEQDGGASDGGDALDASPDAAPRDAATADAARADASTTDELDATAPMPIEYFDTDGTPDAICAAACQFRTTMGCSGDATLQCIPTCQGLYLAATMYGSCAASAKQLQDCEWSRSALALGCDFPADSESHPLCASQRRALAQCIAVRDAPNPGVRSDAGISGNTPEERCESACAYRREVVGCGGASGACEAFCVALRNTFTGPCASLELTLHECRYTKPALDLGCSASDSQIDATACAAQAQAVRACEG